MATWDNQTKNTATWSLPDRSDKTANGTPIGLLLVLTIATVITYSEWANQTKNSASFTNKTKNATTLSNQVKNATTFINLTKS